MGTLLLGFTMLVWAVKLLGWVPVSDLFLGILALITGIVLLLVGFSVVPSDLPVGFRRNQ